MGVDSGPCDRFVLAVLVLRKILTAFRFCEAPDLRYVFRNSPDVLRSPNTHNARPLHDWKVFHKTSCSFPEIPPSHARYEHEV